MASYKTPIYKTQPAFSAKDKDTPEILIGGGALGLTLGGVAGWLMAGVPDAVIGGVLGAVAGGWAAHLILRRVNHVSKDMRMEGE